MAVFENESNASQDASYREHLDRNWLNGNISFDQINQNIVNLQALFTDLSNQVSTLADRVSTLESENNNRIQEIVGLRNELTAYQTKNNERLQRLEDAIFNAEYINDTNERADYDEPTVSQDINETNAVNDDDSLITEQNDYKSLPNEIN